MSARGAVPRAAAFAAAVILVLNSAVMGGAALGHAYLHDEKQRHLIERLKADQAAGDGPYHIFFGPYEGIAHRYTVAGIRFVRVHQVGKLPCANPENIGGPDPKMRLCKAPA